MDGPIYRRVRSSGGIGALLAECASNTSNRFARVSSRLAPITQNTLVRRYQGGHALKYSQARNAAGLRNALSAWARLMEVGGSPEEEVGARAVLGLQRHPVEQGARPGAGRIEAVPTHLVDSPRPKGIQQIPYPVPCGVEDLDVNP